MAVNLTSSDTSSVAEDGKIIEVNLLFYRLPLVVDIPKVEYTVMELICCQGSTSGELRNRCLESCGVHRTSF